MLRTTQQKQFSLAEMWRLRKKKEGERERLYAVCTIDRTPVIDQTRGNEWKMKCSRKRSMWFRKIEKRKIWSNWRCAVPGESVSLPLKKRQTTLQRHFSHQRHQRILFSCCLLPLWKLKTAVSFNFTVVGLLKLKYNRYNRWGRELKTTQTRTTSWHVFPKPLSLTYLH